MKAIRIQIEQTKTDFYTSDFVDLINEIESTEEGVEIKITVREMTALEFTKLLQDGPQHAS
jgi:hypothetical protein